MSEYYVYVAEAYKNGDRIEQIVHKNEDDAKEDIETVTHGDNPDDITVEKRRLYLGEDTEWYIKR